MRKIKDLSGIDYKTNAEGRLLFTALTILTTENYPNKTPDEVIEILNEKSKFLDEDAGLHWAIKLRKKLLINRSSVWNLFVRNITAKLETLSK